MDSILRLPDAVRRLLCRRCPVHRWDNVLSTFHYRTQQETKKNVSGHGFGGFAILAAGEDVK